MLIYIYRFMSHQSKKAEITSKRIKNIIQGAKDRDQ